MSSKQTGKAPAPPVSVDDDENLDDLDDVLTQFSKPPPQAAKPAPTGTASKKPFGPEPPPDIPELGDDEFAAEFARGMEAMMKELVAGGMGTEGKPVTDPQDKEMREAFEKMLMEDLEAGPSLFGESLPEFKPGEKSAGTSRDAAGPSTASASTGQAEDAFQKSIREAMERLKNSENSSKADAANANDPLQALLSQLGDMGDLGDLGGAEDVQGLLENMMAQLLSKDLLYEPLKELDEKFPAYFKENESKLSKEDLDKYKRQQTLISETVKVLESPDYSDNNPEKAAEVMKLMTEMQTLGSPPQEIMGELPPGFALGEDGLPAMGPDGCLIA
ncbi:Peroxisome chaperone and import receptor [Tulasnella sp. UAMH 9824]|nr:Peroxisome chaperone and import receptor [Tulasnella sp. UAMH 9824]